MVSAATVCLQVKATIVTPIYGFFSVLSNFIHIPLTGEYLYTFSGFYKSHLLVKDHENQYPVGSPLTSITLGITFARCRMYLKRKRGHIMHYSST